MKSPLASMTVVAWGAAWSIVSAQTPSVLEGIGLEDHPGIQLPHDLVLTDHEGAAHTLGEFFDGKTPVLVTLAYYAVRACAASSSDDSPRRSQSSARTPACSP